MVRRRLTWLLGCSILGAPLTAWAQGPSAPPGAPSAPPTQAGADAQVGEIVVTAQKREQSIQKVPIAIQAFSGSKLESLNVTTVQDFTALVPTLRVTEPGDPAVSALSLRGVGQRDINVHNEGAVALFLDQAYVSFIPAVGQPIYDVQRVEVLKGPQGTLFGRNATGGLISIISAAPSDVFKGYANVQYGDFNSVKAEGAVGGPISSTVTFRASLLYDYSDGYVKNTAGGDLNGENSLAGRLQIKWEPTSRFNYTLNFHGWRFFDSPSVGLDPTPFVAGPTGVRKPTGYADYAAFCSSITGGVIPTPMGAQAAGNCFTTQPDPYTTAAGPEARYTQNYWGLTGTGEYKITDDITLTSITDYQHLSNRFTVDEDATAAPLFDYTINDRGSEQVSQELRLNGNTGLVKWVTGLYYLTIDHDILNITDLYNDPGYGVRLPAAYQQSTRSIAVFGQADISLTPELVASLGLRGIDDHKTLHNVSTCVSNPVAPPALCTILGTAVFPGALAFNRSYDGGFTNDTWSGRAVLQWSPTRNLMLYGGVTRGTKGGGFNSGGAEFYPLSAVEFKPETLTNYEGGVKGSALNHRVTFDASVFHYDYRDYQSFASSTDGGLRILNVNARINGVEASVAVQPVRGLTLSGGGDYLDTLQKNVPLPGGGTGRFQMPDAPEVSFNGEARYAFPVRGDDELAFQLDAAYVGERSISAIDYPDERIPAYHRLDARVSYAFPGRAWTAAVFVDNFTDEKIIATRVDFVQQTGAAVDTLDRPRFVGASISRRF